MQRIPPPLLPLFASCLFAVVACDRAPVTPGASAPVASGAQAAAGAAASPASRTAATDALFLDFRGTHWYQDTEIPAQAQRAIRDAVLPGSGTDAQVTSRADGAFTRAGARQQAVMLVPGGASTIDPFPPPATLAVLEDGKVVARHTFDAKSGNWQWIRKAGDIDGDGVDELLLSAGWIQMGESATSALLASLSGGDFAQRQLLENVTYSDCEAHAGDPSAGKVEAVRLSVARGNLVAQRYRAACPAPDGEGMFPDPKASDYRPVDAAS